MKHIPSLARRITLHEDDHFLFHDGRCIQCQEAGWLDQNGNQKPESEMPDFEDHKHLSDAYQMCRLNKTGPCDLICDPSVRIACRKAPAVWTRSVIEQTRKLWHDADHNYDPSLMPWLCQMCISLGWIEPQPPVPLEEQSANDAVVAEPIPMLLWCPECRTRHVDAGDYVTKIHHTHACQFCGHVWRPAIVPTVGVRFLPGFKDEAAPDESPQQEESSTSSKVTLYTFQEAVQHLSKGKRIKRFGSDECYYLGSSGTLRREGGQYSRSSISLGTVTFDLIDQASSDWIVD